MTSASSQKLRHSSQSALSKTVPSIQSSRNFWQSCITSLSDNYPRRMKLLAQFFDQAKDGPLYCTHARSEVVSDLFVSKILLMIHNKHVLLPYRECLKIL